MDGHNEPRDDADLQRLRARIAELEQQAEHSEDDVQQALATAAQALAVAAEARSAKSQFLATMSHELRTPLNAIDGYAELMEIGVYGPVTDQQRQALHRLRQAQKRLLSLVDDVLSFAHLEAGSARLSPRAVQVNELFDAVAAAMAAPLAGRSQALTIDRAPPGLSVYADPGGAEQILLNLLANAVKFSSEGSRIHLAAAGAGNTVHIDVTDWGSGIPGDRIDSIFDPFVQVTGGVRRDHAGIGLGLSICRQLAREMDGEIRVRSEAGVGSTFTLVLPAADGAHGGSGGSSGSDHA